MGVGANRYCRADRRGRSDRQNRCFRCCWRDSWRCLSWRQRNDHPGGGSTGIPERIPDPDAYIVLPHIRDRAIAHLAQPGELAWQVRAAVIKNSGRPAPEWIRTVMRAPAMGNEPGLKDTLAEPKSSQSGVIETPGAWLPTTRVTFAVCSWLPALSEARTSIVYVPFERRLFQSSDHALPEPSGSASRLCLHPARSRVPETPEVGSEVEPVRWYMWFPLTCTVEPSAGEIKAETGGVASTFADAEVVETFPAWSVTLIWTVCMSVYEGRCGRLPGAPIHGILRRCDARSGIRGRDRNADAGGIPTRQPGRAGEYRRADDRRSVVDVDRLADVRNIAGVVGYPPLNRVDAIL